MILTTVIGSFVATKIMSFFLISYLKSRFIVSLKRPLLLCSARKLQDQGFVPIINFLGEHYKDKRRVEEAVSNILSLIGQLKEHGIRGKISIKPTQIGLAVSFDYFHQNLWLIAKEAERHGIPLEIDQEGLAYRKDTLVAFLVLPPKYDIRVAIQAYLRESEKDVKYLSGFGKKIRLVKGAYSEGDVPDVNEQMVKLADKLLVFGNDPAIATIRDELLIYHLERFSETRQIPKSKWALQMLYGRKQKLQKELLARGIRVEIYMPAGKFRQALPYLWRRVKEFF